MIFNKAIQTKIICVCVYIYIFLLINVYRGNERNDEHKFQVGGSRGMGWGKLYM